MIYFQQNIYRLSFQQEIKIDIIIDKAIAKQEAFR